MIYVELGGVRADTEETKKRCKKEKGSERG
jgi:hypothetical protein